jgi:hypothetical protein
MLTLVIEDCQIDALEGIEVRVLLAVEEGREVVFILIGRDDAPPGTIKVLPDDFHNKK